MDICVHFLNGLKHSLLLEVKLLEQMLSARFFFLILRNCQTVVQTDYRVFQALLAMHEALLRYVKLAIVLDCSYCGFFFFLSIIPVADNVEPHAMSLLGICISSLRKYLFKSVIYLCLFSVTLHGNFCSIQVIRHVIMNTFSHSVYRLSFHLIQPPTLDR